MAGGSGATPDYELLRELFKHHIDSFDYLVESGLKTMFLSLKPIVVSDPSCNRKLKIWLENPELLRPVKRSRILFEVLHPSECRQAKISYSGMFLADVCFKYDDDGAVKSQKFNFGQFPIMLMSKICNLRGADPQKLVSCKEESSEMGGYFILNGHERVVRVLIVPKRNYPISMVQNSFRDRREGYTDKAVAIRCVREDQSAVTVRLYYLCDGSAMLGFWIGRRECLLPVGVVLKAFVDHSDFEIHGSLTSCYNEGRGTVGASVFSATVILNVARSMGLNTRTQCLQYIGLHFQHFMDGGWETESFSADGETVLKDYIFVHLDKNVQKYTLLIFMVQKLFSLIDKTSVPDNSDSLQNQEVLLPGHLITIYLKWAVRKVLGGFTLYQRDLGHRSRLGRFLLLEKLQKWLGKAKRLLEDEINNNSKKFDFHSLADVRKVMDKNPAKQISQAIENLLKTGRLATQSGLDLQQTTGMTVQAGRLNFPRFLSHFRSVHRGASFVGLRASSVSKLLPESWGFLCPVHTPGGELCGLLNHMTSSCRITSYFDLQGNVRDFLKIRKSILRVLKDAGMKSFVQADPCEVLYVLLDGCVVDTIPSCIAEKAVAYIRRLKLVAASEIPDDLEVGYVPLSMGGAYPGLYLFTSPSRFVRPIRNISVSSEEIQDIELIGPFEQVYMEIKCPDGGDGGRRNAFPATHEEIHPTGILSVVANLTPWSDHNQSTRNLYQCQVAKKTMAFSSQAIHFRADQMLYHLQTPQTPIVRTTAYEKYSMDEYPLGTNAIVAVLSYSGYDTDVAMVLNKSSVDRGLCHGQIYQTDTIDLTDQSNRADRAQRTFRCNVDKSVHSLIDSDGLPYVGQMIHPNEPYCSIYNTETNTTKTINLKSSEPVIVDYVAAVDVENKKHLQKVNIRFRHPRNPVVGDKFSSRHGLKGVCSQLFPDIDMPFSGVTGMRPDIIINPHAFPSGMSIGMLLELFAAKGGCMQGKCVDATPFASSVKKANGEPASESSSLVDEVGSMLTSYGFNYHGNEVLYSGFYGTELTCEIFIGPAYFQRLGHKVSDKFRVRSTGTVDHVTRQPIEGAAIRFGEMERDSLLAHGAAYLLHDRLHTCSDRHIAHVCSLCGSILTVCIQPQRAPGRRTSEKVTCRACRTGKGVEKVAMPYVFRYLAAELAAMNIRMILQLSNGGEDT